MLIPTIPLVLLKEIELCSDAAKHPTLYTWGANYCSAKLTSTNHTHPYQPGRKVCKLCYNPLHGGQTLPINLSALFYGELEEGKYVDSAIR